MVEVIQRIKAKADGMFPRIWWYFCGEGLSSADYIAILENYIKNVES